MVEYILVFLLLFAASLGFYLAFERFVRKPSRPDAALYVQALKDLLDGNEIKAFGKLRQVVAEDSSNVDAYLRLGQILRENGKPDRALQVHRDLTLRAGLPAQEKMAVLRQLARDYFDLQDYDMAEAALKELLSIDSTDRWAHIRQLRIQERLQKWEEAYETASKILKLENNKSRKPLAVYKYRLGCELYKKREYHKARILFKEALGLDPAYVEAYLSIGDSYSEEKRFEDAVSFWKKLIEAVPEEGHLVIDRLKRTLFDLGRYGEVGEMCRNILAQDAKNVEAKVSLAEFYEQKGDLDAAEELLLQVVETEPDNLKSLIELVRILLEKNKRKKIDEVFRMIERRLDARRAGTAGEPVGRPLMESSRPEPA
jgi:lipopolysaccharide biosynthesis regulator YciM